MIATPNQANIPYPISKSLGIFVYGLNKNKAFVASNTFFIFYKFNYCQHYIKIIAKAVFFATICLFNNHIVNVNKMVYLYATMFICFSCKLPTLTFIKSQTSHPTDQIFRNFIYIVTKPKS